MAVDITIPPIGESVTSVFISELLVQIGDQVSEGAPILEFDSDKASLEVPSPSDGTVVEFLVAEGDEVPIGTVVARLEQGAVAVAAPAAESTADTPDTNGVKAGPAARAAAAEMGVSLEGVEGTGKGGRVTTADVSQSGQGACAGKGTRESTGSEALRSGGTGHAAKDESAPAYDRPTARRSAANRRHAHHLQRGGHERGDGVACQVQATVHRQTRPEARLHELLRQGA